MTFGKAETGEEESIEAGVPQAEESIHAPTVTVSLLRQAASVIEAAAEQLPDETVFFPMRAVGELQPVRLEGHVRLADISGLIRYVADMLEV